MNSCFMWPTTGLLLGLSLCFFSIPRGVEAQGMIEVYTPDPRAARETGVPMLAATPSRGGEEQARVKVDGSDPRVTKPVDPRVVEAQGLIEVYTPDPRAARETGVPMPAATPSRVIEEQARIKVGGSDPRVTKPADRPVLATPPTSKGVVLSQPLAPFFSAEAIQPTAPVISEPVTEMPSGLLTLNSAVARAMQWHPAIARSLQSYQEQLSNVEVARAGYYPQIKGGLKNGYDSASKGRGSNQAVVLSASQMLYDFGKVASSVEAAEAGVNQRQAEIMLSIDQVAQEAASAFLEIQRYQKLLEIAQGQISSLEKITDLARQRQELGASTRSDYIQAVSRIDGAKVTQLQHAAQLSRWRGELANLLDVPAVATVSADFPKPLEQSCQIEPRDLEESPVVLASLALLRQAQARLKGAQAGGLPTVSLDPSVSHSLKDDPRRDQDRTQYGVFLNLNMPIYQGGSIRAGQAASERAVNAAMAAVENARLSSRSQLRQAQTQVIGLNQSLGAQVAREQTIAQTRDLYRQQYLELGTRSLLDLLNAEQETYQSRFDHQNTRSNLHALQISCLYSSGQLRRVFAHENSSFAGNETSP